MDERIPRLWHIQKGWSDVPDWGQIKKSPYIFLSRSPLTFGHSQLVVPSPDDCNEEALFRLASEILCCAISTFRRAFADQKLHENEAFKSLAENTLTYGPYMKTLVLRASAQENSRKEYKVHLVPYFASHASLCKKRFLSLHAVNPEDDDTGGLFGWLGEREDDVDRWEADKTHMEKLDEIANNRLKMPDLAQKLRNLWPSVK